MMHFLLPDVFRASSHSWIILLFTHSITNTVGHSSAMQLTSLFPCVEMKTCQLHKSQVIKSFANIFWSFDFLPICQARKLGDLGGFSPCQVFFTI